MKIYFTLAILGVFTASCQRRHVLNMDQKTEVEPSKLPLGQRELEQALAIPRPIHQAATKQLIGAMVPGEVLCVAITPEHFQDLGLNFNGFVAALHGSDQEKICFIMKQVMQDLAPILQQYYTQSPDVIRVVEVEDCCDFKDLSDKTGVGAGTIKSNHENRATWIGTYRNFYDCINYTSGWKTLDKEKIQSALEQVPSQAESWSCGPNSAARALILAGRSISQFDIFLRNCPRGSEVARKKAKVVTGAGIGAFIGGALLTAIPGAAPIGAAILATGWGSAMGGMVTQGIADSYTTGPSPHYLSEYINQHLPCAQYSKSKVFSYESFSSCATAIIDDIKDGDPVIAFFLYEPILWHYANVVATQGNGDKFMILETKQYFEWLNYSDMEDLMRNDYGFLTFFGCKGHIGKYNIIRFYRK